MVQLNDRTEKEKIEKSGLLAMAKQRYQQITSKKKAIKLDKADKYSLYDLELNQRYIIK